MSRITYNDLEEFYNGIHAMVKRGLSFEADADALTITLTGGF